MLQLKSFLLQSGLAAECALLAGIVAIVVLTLAFPRLAFGLSFWVVLFSLAAAFYLARFTPVEGSYTALTFGGFSGYIKQFLCVSASVSVFGFIEWRQGRLVPSRVEVFPALLLSVFSLCVLVQAEGCWLMVLAAELFSICGYVLARPVLANAPSAKSVVHYFSMGALATAIGIFGLSFIVGFQLVESDLLTAEFSNLRVFPVLGSVLFLSFLLFKLGSFPFHFWVPAVYEHAPTPWVGYLSVAPKVAAAFAIFHLLELLPPQAGVALIVVALVGATWGNLAALGSENLRNMLAYSSIAQAAMLLVPAIAAARLPDAENHLLMFAVAYGVANQGVFCAVQYFENVIGDRLRITNLGGQLSIHPLPAMAFIVLILSVVGLPPTIGFITKLLLFSTLVPATGLPTETGQNILYAVLIFNTLLSMAYYIKIPFQMIFRQGETDLAPLRTSAATLFWTIISSLFAILAFVRPDLFFPVP